MLVCLTVEIILGGVYLVSVQKMVNRILIHSLILLFNVVEMVCVYLVGRLLGLPTDYTIMLMLLFIVLRMTFKKPMHYKSPYVCFIMTLLVFLSLFMVFHIDLSICVLSTVFASYVLTGKGNIGDMFMWSGKSSKFDDVMDYIKFNEFNDNVIKFEAKIKEQDNLSYLVYKYRFKERKSFNEISELLDLDTARISEIQDKIAFAFRVNVM